MRDSNPRPVFLSPHLDDAVLSCGGLIYERAKHGLHPLVITCFAGAPDYRTLSPLAAEQHRMWGQPTDPIAHRRGEDAAAMAYLGSHYQHWQYLDCIYRRQTDSGVFLYATEAALFGKVSGDDLGLADQLAARLARPRSVEGTVFYAPLAVGHHVDHQILSQTGRVLCSGGYKVMFYEDHPYAEDGDSLASALQEWPCALLPAVHALNEEALWVKIRAIRCYHSQVGVLFGSEEAVAGRVRSYAAGVGEEGGAAERYWTEDAR